MNKFISEKIAKTKEFLLNSKLVQTSNSLIGIFGKIGKIAQEKTKSCSQANHSL